MSWVDKPSGKEFLETLPGIVFLSRMFPYSEYNLYWMLIFSEYPKGLLDFGCKSRILCSADNPSEINIGLETSPSSRRAL
ncbi:hypothetical protein HWI79_1181 [Cryptosporidium felis]|nr:hypothetical protein HWI79_1181 [Cryptosporidium felis]